MRELCEIKESLIEQVQSQMLHPECVNTHELGEVIDMIKDLSEACYYFSIVEAMEEKEEEAETYWEIGTMPEDNKKMGHSPLKRKSYIESKEKHLD